MAANITADFGALVVPAAPGWNIQLAGDGTDNLSTLILVGAHAAIELSAHAAPSTQDYVEEIFTATIDQILATGSQWPTGIDNSGDGLSVVLAGPDGRWLCVHVRGGPRWALRAVITADDDDAGVFEQARILVDHVDVHRGDEAVPAGGALPLRPPAGWASTLTLTEH